jgi:esterase/lipase
VYIHGWAMGHDMFPFEDSAVYCTVYNPVSFLEDMARFLHQNTLKEINLVGFSMGAQLCIDIANNLDITTPYITLIGLPVAFNKNDITAMKKRIKKNKLACLHHFYRNCFHHQEDFRVFYEEKGSNYIEELNEEALLKGLLYLEKRKVTQADFLKKKTVTFIHGKEDKIAPLSEVIRGINPPDIHIQKEQGHYIDFKQLKVINGTFHTSTLL